VLEVHVEPERALTVASGELFGALELLGAWPVTTHWSEPELTHDTPFSVEVVLG
jgi:hypothetical protein